MKRALLLCLVTLITLFSWAADTKYNYDFAQANADGVIIYYRITSDTTVETQNGSPSVYATETYFGDVTIPETVTYEGKTYTVTGVGADTFMYSGSLTSVSLPSTITYIEEYAFFQCSSLKEIILPDGVTSIGVDAFYECMSLEYIEIPESVSSIGLAALCGCVSLKSVKIPRGLSYLPGYLFSDCTTLVDVELPLNLTSLDAGIFYHCVALTTAYIPSTVVTLGIDLFRQCTSLQTVTLPMSVEMMDDGIFSSCSKLKTVYAYNPEPPSINFVQTGPFSGISSDCVLYVPIGAKEKYEKANGFSGSFKEIIEMNMLSVSTDRGASDISATSATISGSAVAGDLEMTERGFEYWTGTEDLMTVVVDGDEAEMTATLTDLEPNTTYSFRAYAIDATGTIYGRTRTFTTSEPDGIEAVALDGNIEVSGYYTLGGQRVNAPQRGVNIVKFVDGTTKKLLIK